MERAEIEREIAGDEEVLLVAARLIASHAPIATWPDDVRAVYELAVDDTRASRADRWQIVALRRHLFGGDVVHEEAPQHTHGENLITRRRAERLRDGLCSLVAFRTGRYLLG